MRYRVMRSMGNGGPRETFECDEFPADLHRWPIIVIDVQDSGRHHASADALNDEKEPA